MNQRLRDRVNMGIRGAIPLTDSHRQIHLDHLTYTLQLEEKLEVLDTFFHFIDGYVGSPNHDLPEAHMKPLAAKLKSVQNDLRRLQPRQHAGC